MNPCRAYHGRDKGTLLLRFCGDMHCGRDWSFGLSRALSTYLDQVFRSPDFEKCVIDLSEVITIDSTNLGLLARIASEMIQLELEMPILVCPPSDVLTTIEGVGFDTIFTIVPGYDTEVTATEPITPDQQETASLRDVLLDSHRRLVVLNDGNAARFGHIVEAIALDQGM